MVNPNRLIKITKAESKDLLDKAQDIIKKDILGDKFQGDKLLKKDKPGLFRTQSIKWNFTKFLINSNGKIVERFSPRVEPKYIRQEIKKIL